jgi:penicillin-binding protein 2
MKFIDTSQNLRARLGTIQIIAFLVLGLLGARLYYLQIANGEKYRKKAEEQRIRLLPIPAPRGAILDRTGKHILVDSRPTYNIVLSREDAMKNKNLNSLAENYAAGLNLDPEYLRERFEQMETQRAFDSLVVKENATSSDIAWVEAHSYEHPELRVELQPQRVYPPNGFVSHVVGYVGEISKEQLEKEEYKKRGLKPGDIIGLKGLEAYYDEYLRGVDGYRKVIVDSRGRIQQELYVVPPQPGQDLISTIDYDLQQAAEQALAESATKRGVIVAMDPNNGEILAMASSPNFDPNLFSQRISTKEGRKEYAALLNDIDRPLYNRAIQGRYYPGSTWKIPMSAEGLMQGKITVQKSNLACGGGIQIGNKFTRCMGNHGAPPLGYAITRSCDGYYYRLGIKLGPEGYEKLSEDFEFNKKTGVDLSGELQSHYPSREYKRKRFPKEPEWREIDNVYASIGQVHDEVTPLALLRAISSIAVGGKMYVPYLMKEFRPIAAIGNDPESSDYRKERPGFMYQTAQAKIISLTPEQHKAIVDGMWGTVNAGGTAGSVFQKWPDFEIAGKTGTAQVAALGQDTGRNKDHAWFVSFAPAYKPEISMVALIENSGFGGRNAAPASRLVYEKYYYRKTGQQPPANAQQQVAMNKKKETHKTQ